MKKELSKSELKARKETRRVWTVRIVGALVILVMLIALCAGIFRK